jgi:hypothetical protein
MHAGKRRRRGGERSKRDAAACPDLVETFATDISRLIRQRIRDMLTRSTLCDIHHVTFRRRDTDDGDIWTIKSNLILIGHLRTTYANHAMEISLRLKK